MSNITSSTLHNKHASDKPNVTVEYKDVPVGHVGIITCIGHGRPMVTLSMFHEESPVTNVTSHV